MERACETCGEPFTTHPTHVRAGNGRYCSQQCFGLSRRNQVERQCGTCGVTFMTKRAYVVKGRGKFCSMACSVAARGQRKDDIAHRMRRAPNHPIAPPSGIAAISRMALYDSIGPGPHPCHWCQIPVDWKLGAGVRDPLALLVDHLDHDPTNDDLSNLVPSCNPCNSHRRLSGKSAIIQPGELTITRSDRKPVRAVERTCETCEMVFLAAASEVKKGKARFCSRSCARKAPRTADR